MGKAGERKSRKSRHALDDDLLAGFFPYTYRPDSALSSSVTCAESGTGAVSCAGGGAAAACDATLMGALAGRDDPALPPPAPRV